MSRSHENSNIASVMPFSSAFASLAAEGCMYLYSFVSTRLEKKGFSLKCYLVHY